MNKKIKITAILLSILAVLSVGWTVMDSNRLTGEIASGEAVAVAVIKQGATGNTVRTIQQKLKRYIGIFPLSLQKIIINFKFLK